MLRFQSAAKMMWERVETSGDVPTPKKRHTTIHYNNKLYVFGGWCQRTHQLVNDLDVLDLSIESPQSFVSVFCYVLSHLFGLFGLFGVQTQKSGSDNNRRDLFRKVEEDIWHYWVVLLSSYGEDSVIFVIFFHVE
jgi:hypothetical protein